MNQQEQPGQKISTHQVKEWNFLNKGRQYFDSKQYFESKKQRGYIQFCNTFIDRVTHTVQCLCVEYLYNSCCYWLICVTLLIGKVV